MLALAIFLLAQAPPADDDCSLSRDAIKPMLDGARLERYTTEQPADRRSVIERALVDGRAMEATLGGCAHYAFSFSFALKPGEGATLELAMKLVSALPPQPGERPPTAILLDALKDARAQPALPLNASNNGVDLPCGSDARCEMTVSGRRLTVSYDFPL